jgi:predicted component of viral defense system (DUF524 family)
VPISTAIPDTRLLGAEEETDKAELSSTDIPAMVWREAGNLFECFQLREDTDYFVDIVVPLGFYEATQQAKAHNAWPFDERLASVFLRDPPRRWRQLEAPTHARTIITGTLRLRSHAGVIGFSTPFGGTLHAEVVCRKLNYFDEFKALIDSLAEKTAELLLAYDSPVSVSFAKADKLAANESALYFLMRYVMSPGKLPLAAQEIIADPHTILIERVDVSAVEGIDEADEELIISQLDVSALVIWGPLARLFPGYTPRELPRRDTFESLDTQENRYAKAFLEHCRTIAQRLESGMELRRRRAAEREARGWRLTLDEVLQHGMWREIGPLGNIPANSQTLQRKRGYRDMFRYDMALRLSLRMSWQQGADLAEGLIGDIRPVSQIYEYWCFLTLREVLRTLCREVDGGNLVAVSRDGFQVHLVKGRRSECRFNYTTVKGAAVRVSLFYNRRFMRSRFPLTQWGGSYTASFNPDFSIQATKVAESSVTHWLHFDAKYRLERWQADGFFDSPEEDDDGSVSGAAFPRADSYSGQIASGSPYAVADSDKIGAQLVKDPAAFAPAPNKFGDYESELSRVYTRDDLFKMHTYREGILSTRGAYVLFPGDGIGGRVENPKPNLFVRHPSALGEKTEYIIPSVGAFPLTPAGSVGQIGGIRELLRVALETVAEGGPYVEETAFYGPQP